MTRVVMPDELGKPDESLRAQMKKLEISPKEGEHTLTHSSPIHKTHSLLYIMHEVNCVIRLHTVCTWTHIHIYGLCITHVCLVVFFSWESSLYVASYMYSYNYMYFRCRGDVWLHSSGSGIGGEQSQKEKQERRAEAERQEQLQQEGVSSECPTLNIIPLYLVPSYIKF